jgi:alpha-L-rhamnosidase
MIGVLYRHYGDRRGLVYFDDLVDYLRKVDALCPDGLVPQCIGDHETLDRNLKGNGDTATIYYHEFVRLTERFAGLLGRDAERTWLAALRAKIFAAFNAKYVKDGRVGNGVQGAQALALEFGLIPSGQIAAADRILLDDIEAHGGALTTGIFGTRALLLYLTRTGRADLAARLVTRTEYPGWLYMLSQGATTLWESWKGGDDGPSLNHPMFGSVDGWMIRTLLGVTVGDNGEITFEPKPVAGVTWAKGSFRMPDGTVRRIAWRLDEHGNIIHCNL